MLILTGSNSNTGAITLSAGVLRILNSNALGTTAGGVTVPAGAALELQNNITVGAEALSIVGTGISTTGALRNISGTNTWGGLITINNAATRINSDAGELILDVATGNALTAASADPVTFGGAGNITINDPISNQVSTVTKDGAGTLTLAAVNAYTGATTVSAGVLRATTSASALGASTLTLSGGNLELANDSGLNFARNTTVSTSGTIFSERLAAGAGVTHTLGTLSIGAQTLSIATDASVTSGTAGITFGNVTQTGASTFDVASGAALTLGALQTTAQNITKQGAGILFLNSAANAARVAGVNTVSAGTMQLGSTSAIGTTGATLTLNGGAINLATDTTVNAYNTTVGGNATIVSNKATAASAGVTHTLGTLAIGANTLSIAAGANVSSGTAAVTFGNVTQTGASTFDVASGAALTLGALQTTAQNITKQGAGILFLNTAANAARVAGVNTVSAGTMQLGSVSALGTTGATLTLNGGAINLATDTSVNAYNTTVGGNATIVSNKSSAASAGITHTLGTLSIGANTLSIAAGANATGATAAVTFGASTLSGNPTFDVATNTTLTLGALADGGTGRTLTKQGTGSLTLGTAASSLGAGTVVNVTAGTLNANAAGALGSSADVTVSSGATLAYGASGTVAGLSGAGSVSVGNTFALTVNNASNGSFSGVISGAGGVTKTAAGTLTLGGANTYTGATTISAGTLSASSIVVAASASNLGNATSAVVLGDGSNQGTLSYTGNSATYTRGFTVNAGGGRFDVTTGGQTVTIGTGNVTGSGLFTVGGAGNVTVSSTLQQSAGLTKTGTGTLTLSAQNTYTGDTTVSEGTVTASSIVVESNASNLGNATSAVVLGGASSQGTLSYTGNTANYTRGFTVNAGGGRFDVTTAGQTVTIGTGGVGGSGLFTVGGAGNVNATAVISTIGGLTKTGTGTLTLSGENTFGGALAGNAGVIRATSSAAALGAGTLTLAGSALELANDTGLNFGRDTTVSTSGTIFSERLTAGAGVTHTLGALSIGGQTLTLATDATVTGGTAALAFSGLATLTGNPTFDTAAGTELLFNNGLSGAFGITKTGSGTLTLNGGGGHANTTVSAGRLNINSLQALGTLSGTLSLAADTTLGNTSGNNVTVGNAKSIALGSSLNFVGPSNLNVGEGTTTLSATNTTINVAAGTLTFGGNIVGNGLGITKTGTGVLVFTHLGAGAYTGNTTISQGELFLDNLSVLGGGTNTIVTIDNNAFLRVGPSASTGQVTVRTWTGGLILESAQNLDVVFTSSGTLTASDKNINGTQTITPGVIVSSFANNFGTTPLSPVPNRIIIQNGGGIQALDSFDIEPNQGVELTSGTARFDVTATGTQRLFVESVISGAGTLRKTGSNNLRLLGENTYTGGTIIEQGIIGIVSDASLGAVSGGVQILGAELVGAKSGTVATDVTINAARSITIGNGTTSAISAQTDNRLAYSGILAEVNGGGTAGNLRVGFSSQRSGTVVLGGANTYRGSTTLAAGTLEVAVLANGGVASGIGQSLNAAGNLVFEAGSTLRFTGGSASTDRLFTIGAGGGKIDSGTGTLAFTNSGTAALAGSGARTFILGGSGTGQLATILADLNPSNKTSLTKTGAGTWEITSAQQFTGNTSLQGGSLLVNGSLASNVVTAASTTLGGSGVIAGTISGAGLVSPGNSPGITTAVAFDPTGGLDAAFEFTQLGAPTWSSGSASGNDVLRLTDATSPFTANLGAGNVIDVYFNVASLKYLDTFQGGFFTGQDEEQLLTAIENAQFNFWFMTTDSGVRTFNGVNYNPLNTAYSEFTGARVETKAVTNANFASGTVNGTVTQFVVVPEPTMGLLAGLGGLTLAVRVYRRRRR